MGALPVEVLNGEVLVGTDDSLSYEVLLQGAERVSPQHLQPVQQLRDTHAVRRTQTNTHRPSVSVGLFSTQEVS